MKYQLPYLLACSIWAGPSFATIDWSNLNLKGEINYQQSFELEGDWECGTIGTLRFGNNDLKYMIGEEMGMQLPRGSQVQLGLEGGSRVVDRDDNFLYDTSTYLDGFINTSNTLYDGKFNIVTGEENSWIKLEVDMFLNFPSAGWSVNYNEGYLAERFRARLRRDDELKATQNMRGILGGGGAVFSEPGFANALVRLYGMQTPFDAFDFIDE